MSNVASVAQLKTLAVSQNGALMPAYNSHDQIKCEPVDFTSGATAIANVFDNACRFIRICAGVDCYYAIGKNAVATANDNRLGAGAYEYIGVTPGDTISFFTAP